MNHLPFDWSDAVDDNHVVAHFIGGAWDGKTYAIPKVPEWHVASLPAPRWKFFNKPPEELVSYDILIYRAIICVGKEAIYWLSRTEKSDE
jgi:hypothetical protein